MKKVVIFNDTASKIYFKDENGTKGIIKARGHSTVSEFVANKLCKMYRHLEVIDTKEEALEIEKVIETIPEAVNVVEEDPFEAGDVVKQPAPSKEYRRDLLKKAKDLELNLPKNISTAELEGFIEAANEAKNAE